MKLSAPAVKRFARQRIPKDVLAVARRRFGQPQPWDPGVVLPPPECPPGQTIGAPDFVGVGTQKSGTSWWYNVIASHAGVHDVSGAHKERHFFSRFYDQPFGSDDITAYHRWFPRPGTKLVGEWTPQYMHQAWVPNLLAQAAPNAKILVLLRDPIERYRSGLTHYAARDHELDSRLAVDAIERGMYAHQLTGLFRSFPAEQVLVLQYEACRADPESAAVQTFEFLGIEPERQTAGVDSEVNTTKIDKVPLPDHLRSALIDLYRPDIDRLVELVPNLDLDLWKNFGRS